MFTGSVDCPDVTTAVSTVAPAAGTLSTVSDFITTTGVGLAARVFVISL